VPAAHVVDDDVVQVLAPNTEVWPDPHTVQLNDPDAAA